MNQDQVKVFLNRLNLIIAFLEKPKTYKYVDILNDVKTEFTSLKDFPIELSLFLQDKEVREVKKIQNKETGVTSEIILKDRLATSVSLYIFDRNISWQHFTGDHCYPIPIKEIVNQNYLPLYGWYRNQSDFYIKANSLCISYFKHLREPLL